jgi:hypothetical protein
VSGRVGLAQGLRLLDLSAAGARIRTGEALAPGRSYAFRLGPFELVAAVVRCALVALEPDDEGARPVVEAGLAFATLSGPQRRQLQRLAVAAAVAPRSAPQRREGP